MRILLFSFPAGLLVLALLLGAASPVAGVWEGQSHGAKAVTLTVREEGRHIAGTAIFYIIRDEGSGEHNGSASGEIPMIDPVWDGKVLRFSIDGPHGESGKFTMKQTSTNTAELVGEGRAAAVPLRQTK